MKKWEFHIKKVFTHKIQLSKESQADVNIAMDNQHVDDIERERNEKRENIKFQPHENKNFDYA